MAGYKRPCRYCDNLVPPESNVCPVCGKVNPLGSLRCPKCRNPIKKGWVRCPDCGLSLEVKCPQCGKTGFFGDYCEHCDARLTVTCQNPKCRVEQPPLGGECAQCGKPL